MSAPDQGYPAALAIVGGGPRALSALVALDDALAARNELEAAPITVLLFDEATPGAGAVWRTDQPEHLLLNVDATIADFSGHSVEASFREWARRDHPEYARERFVPRALMGRYLSWCYEQLNRSPRLAISHVAARVREVERNAEQWLVHTDTGTHTALGVLLCTGHADRGGIDHAGVAAAVVAGSHVQIRGAALTGIDVVLDLTEGHGGRWQPAPETPSGLRYVPTGREPRLITVLSRSGALMTPKPRTISAAVREAVQAEMAQLRPGQQPDDDWWAVLVRAAVAAARAEGFELHYASVERALDRGREHGRDRTGGWRELAADLARGRGQLDADPAWWLGRAWTIGYEFIVTSLERGERDWELWQRFRRRAARLERWAFGPPERTAARILALYECGLLEVRIAAGEAARADDALGADSAEGVLLINAVTAGPGVLRRPLARDGSPRSQMLETVNGEPWASLINAGWVSVRVGERGVWTTPSAQCVRADGEVAPGLWALGRPSEDPVIGHDTLSRTLHRDTRRWAAQVAGAYLGENEGELA